MFDGNDRSTDHALNCVRTFISVCCMHRTTTVTTATTSTWTQRVCTTAYCSTSRPVQANMHSPIQFCHCMCGCARLSNHTQYHLTMKPNHKQKWKKKKIFKKLSPKTRSFIKNANYEIDQIKYNYINFMSLFFRCALPYATYAPMLYIICQARMVVPTD